MEKKNLLIIGSSFCLEAGGIENTNYLLAEFMRPYMNVFTFSTVDGKVPNIDGVKSYQGNVSFNDPRKRLGYFKDTLKIVKNIHKEYHIDFILCANYNFGFSAWVMKRKYGIPYGVMTYGNDVYKKWIKQRNLINQIAWFCLDFIKRQILLNNANQIYSCSSFTRELVGNVTTNKNVMVIHPPIGLKSERFDVEGKYKGNILYLGRLDERKGVQNVIKVLPQILKRYENIKFIIAGGGPFEHQLKELVAELKLDGAVDFKGRVSEEEKKELLKNCGVFVTPSINMPERQSVEGFGLAMVEANAYGKFVISTYSGGIPDAVKNNATGFLVKENDLKELADAILKFYGKDFTYDKEECYKWADEHHISNIVKQYNSSISAIISNA